VLCQACCATLYRVALNAAVSCAAKPAQLR
jgi:hypothetical protein